MGTYRLLFFDDGIICGRFVFHANDDDRAAEIAAILFDACSDCCQSWGIWDGYEFVSSGPIKSERAEGHTRLVRRPHSRTRRAAHLGVRLRASDLAERMQENIVECEETIRGSEWAIASSTRLLAELDKLKASAKSAMPRLEKATPGAPPSDDAPTA